MKIKLTSSKTLVIIDAGHGIDTPGKRSPIWSDKTQLFEYKFNREIVDKIVEFVGKANISYISIINTDKDTSLQDRCSTINNFYDAYKDKYFVYLISVHGNAADNIPTANGIEVWTTKGVTKSDKIADVFFNKLKTIGWKMRNDISDGDNDKEENFYILKNSNCPAVLTENGFYTNEQECKKMLTPEITSLIALCHANAIIDIDNNYRLYK